MADRNEDFNWYRGPRRPLERLGLFIIVSFLSSFSFLPSVLQRPSPIFRERFTETACNITCAFAEVTYLREVDTQKVLQKIVRRHTWSDARGDTRVHAITR